MASCTFDRPRHQRVARFLASLNADFLAQSCCYFGGGTAIVLSLNEYRESADVDFLCSSVDGYRALRNTITSASLGDILSQPVELAREVRADRYGIRTSRRAYGHSVDVGYSKAVSLVSDQAYLSSCLQKLSMQPVLARRILALLQGSQPSEG